VLLGGGQDASQVTTTAAKAGGFEARFFHKVRCGAERCWKRSGFELCMVCRWVCGLCQLGGRAFE
jgi:hypothetical protein